MTERRYREDEVREIFKLATSSRKVAEPRASPTVDGLTLADIQSIGLEVGVEPDAVARAAATISARPARTMRKSMGMPVEVGRIVHLPRALTDHEWDQLVAELRATFKARGKVSGQGSLREWSNGNLHAYVEPTDTGYRLRLGTLKGNAAEINALGATLTAGGALFFGALAFNGLLPELLAPGMIAGGGIAALISNFVRLPRWAQQRERQMEHIAARVQAIVKVDPA
jgi:hypothetical protein